MSIPTAQLELTRSPVAAVPADGVPAGHAPAIAAMARAVPADDTLLYERPLVVSRGIVIAVLISVPFWALTGFTLYLLM